MRSLIGPTDLGCLYHDSGIYFSFDSPFTISSSSRFRGFGYDVQYMFFNGKLPDTFNPTNGNIGIGFSFIQNAYAGIKWNKHHFIDLGFLYRPLNQLSIGLTARFDDKLTEHHQSIFGLALRPFFKHRLTIGADMHLFDNASTSIYPHLTFQPLNGIALNFRSDADFDDFKVNLAFNSNISTYF